jgi:hypothetical protein
MPQCLLLTSGIASVVVPTGKSCLTIHLLYPSHTASSHHQQGPDVYVTLFRVCGNHDRPDLIPPPTPRESSHPSEKSPL